MSKKVEANGRLGPIPKDWTYEYVGGAAAARPNAIVGGPFGSDLVSADYVDDGVPVIRGQNMSGHFVGGEFVFVTEVKARRLRANLARPHDLVFTQRGTLGQVALIPDIGFTRYLVSQSQMKVSLDLARYNPLFVLHFFKSEFGQKQIRESAIQTGVPHTNLGILRKYVLPTPPLAEQQDIGEALSDVESALGGLNQLVEKKRDVKQAVMQQLLAGRTRLPGYNGQWVKKRLGDLGEVRSGGTPATSDPSFWDGGIAWCTPTDITALSGRKHLISTVRTISTKGLAASSAEVIPPRSLILTSRATIGECAINLVPMTTNQGFKNVIPNANTDVDFMYYLMSTQKSRLIALCAGSTFLEIGKKQLEGFELFLPGDRNEQSAIAQAISDMDAEIDALAAQKRKMDAVKEGMMQALLTGRIRLPVAAQAKEPMLEAAHG